MLILLIFAFISGLVTILAPCIWPLLPIILSSTVTGGKSKPLGITLGVTFSFAVLTLSLSYIVKIIPIDADALRILAVFVIGLLGLSLLIPKMSEKLEEVVSRLSSRLAPAANKNSGFLAGFIGGLSLGIIWSPCAGPILATIATLAATQKVNLQVILVTLSYVFGFGVPLFIFTWAGQYLFQKSRLVSPYTARIQQFFGLIMILTALAILGGYDRVIEANLLNSIPAYSTFLYQLEGQKAVTDQLQRLKNGPMPTPSAFSLTQPSSNNQSSLPNLGPAPDFTGITNWLNLPDGRKSLSLSDLRGRVVLVDFWTYTCINCIRTLPFTTSWYEKYKDKGFVLVGVHTPEFEFEKKTDNVQNALKQYNINYPVAQDNSYATWNAYSNQYWPAEYLIDAKGNVRHVHFGEGSYDETEKAIQSLLKEAGLGKNINLTTIPDQTPKSVLTPETYVGLTRMERFASPQSPQKGVQNFSLPADLPTNYFALGGSWDMEDEYALAQKDSILQLKFQAAKVYLVITPQTGSDVIDVSVDGEKTQTIKADVPKLYTLVDLKDSGIHLLQLDFKTPGTKIFAFTFGD